MFEREQWYERYLPTGVRKADLSEADIDHMIQLFTDIELDAEDKFFQCVSNAFYEVLKGSMAGEISPLLPKSPVAIQWIQLDDTQRADIRDIYLADQNKGVTEKTIRKHIRKYLTPMIEKLK